MGMVFTPFAFKLAKAEIDLPAAISGNKIKTLLVMTDSLVATEEDSEFVADISVLDEFDGPDYAREVATGVTYVEDDPNNQGVLDCDPVDYGSQNDGTRAILGGIVYLEVTTDADSILIAYYPATTPFNPGGIPVRIAPTAAGLLNTVAANT